MIEWSLLLESLPSLGFGALFSIFIALASAFLGLCGGSLLAVMQASNLRSLKAVATIYITIMRGSPMLVQIMFLFYVAPQIGIWMSPMAAAILAMGLNSSAYLSQVIRVGFGAVDLIEIEAAKGLGMDRFQILKYLILPQTWRSILPALGNEATTLLKDSSLASVVGVVELTKAGAIIRARTYDAFTSIFAVALVYLILTFIIGQFFAGLEKGSKKPCSW